MNPPDETKIIVAGISKVIIATCIMLFAGFSVHSCKLDTQVIEDCNSACREGLGEMETVTVYKCTCSESKKTQSPWVISK